MRLSAAVIAGAAAVVSLGLAGCAATVPGEGRAAPIEATPEPSEEPTDDPTEDPTGDPTEDPTDDPPLALDCAEPAVAPEGAPYCYTAPAGLDAVDLGDPSAGEAGEFRTSYGFGPPDHIDVQAYDVGIDTDAFSDDDLIAELGSVIDTLEAGGFDFPDAPTTLDADGARGFAYAGSSTAGTQLITAHFFFRGSNEVQINCASTNEVPTIDEACDSVLASLQIS